MHKKFTLIVVITIILIGPIGQFILFKFTPLYDLNLLTELYNDASWVKGKPKIVIMGSSHARYHIIPKEIAKLNKGYEFKDIVNIGENAASPFEMYTAFIKNRDKFSALETVYYTLEPHILGEKYYPYNKYEEILLNYSQWKYLEENQKKNNNYFFPFQTFIKSLTFETSNRLKSNGYSALRHKKFNEFSKGKVLKQICKPLELFPVSIHGIKYFKKLKDELNKQGTELIFVLTPTYSWQKYYAQEGKKYDDMLIRLLNENLGNIKIIGSFWPEDFDLKYKDFKDDTHMAHSGSLRFTQETFNNIHSHKLLKEKKLINTFLYRVTSTKKQCVEKLSISKKANTFKWEFGKDVKVISNDKYIELSYSNIEKFTLLDTKLKEISNISSIELLIELPKEKIKMFSITLRDGKEYGHFFIKPQDIKNKMIKLTNDAISKTSKNFELSSIDGITIRVYPENSKSVHSLKIKMIKFNTCK